MKTFEKYHQENKEKVIDFWKKSESHVMKGLEKDPVTGLLLSALSYYSFLIQNDVEKLKEKTIDELLERTIPYQLIKPIPAFSIVETKPLQAVAETTTEGEFKFKNWKFYPLLKTKLINAELRISHRGGNTWTVELHIANPVENLSLAGMSFFINDTEPVNIESIRYGNFNLPIIRPSQYDELPFAQWFNNAHLFQKQNYYLYGTYDYWQEIFLTNTSHLFHIGPYDSKKVSMSGKTRIELEVTLNSYIDLEDKLKINCIPLVNIEKKEVTLNENNPVHDLSGDTGEFLNLLVDPANMDVDEYMDSFMIRQYGVERYNPKQLLAQMQEILDKYNSDYYAFQSINELKNSDKLKTLQEVVKGINGVINDFENKRYHANLLLEQILQISNKIHDIAHENDLTQNQTIEQMQRLISEISSDVVDRFENEAVKGRYYAILKKNEAEYPNVHLEYLTTSGVAANGIKKGEKATKVPNYIDRNKTALLTDTRNGRNSIRDDSQKEDIAKYYFLTKDRIITATDIRTFLYKEIGSSNVEAIKIRKDKENNCIRIDIQLTADSDVESIYAQKETLQQKMELRAFNLLPYKIHFY